MYTRKRSLMGNRFLSYLARDNNGGLFVMTILRANNLSTPVNTLFVEQTTEHLFMPQLRRITNTIASGVDKIFQG
jgi:hypothetical protein